MNYKKLILYSSFYRILGSFSSIAIAFLITPYLINSLGDTQYGLWLLILTVLGWFHVISLGFPAAVQREIARALEAGDNNRINVIFSCSVVLFSGMGVIAAALAIMLGMFPEALGVDEENYTVVRLSFLALSVKLFWDFLMNCYHGFYAGLIRYDLDANINTANEIMKAILIVLLVRDLHVYGAVLATMVADFIANIVKVRYLRKLHPGLKFDKKLVNVQEFGALWDYGKHVIVNSIAVSFGGKANLFIISHLIGLGAVAIYGVASRLVDMVEKLYLSVLGVFHPIFIRVNERKGDISQLTEQVVSLNFFLVSIFIIPLIILAADFLTLWLGDGFSESSPLVALICAAFLCRTISRPISAVLLATANHKWLSVINLIGLILNVLFAVILGYKFGLLGVATGVVISFFCNDVLMHLVLYRIYIKKPIRNFAKGFVLTSLFVGISAALGIRFFANIPQLDWIGLISWGAAIFLLAVLLFWLLLLNRELKQIIFNIAKSQIGNVLSRLG